MAREQFEQATREFQRLVQTFQEYRVNRSELLTQLNENECVEEELKLLRDGCTLYKIVGPVLVKQSHSEAKNTVGKRLEYIRGELKRYDKIEEEVSLKIREAAEQIKIMERKAAEGELQQRSGRS